MLAVSFFSVVGEYMRLLLFICLPVILLSTGLAVWLHYRQKKRKRLNETALVNTSEISLSFPDPSEIISISPLAVEDKFNLVKECRKQLARSKAKFMALKHDFASAATKLAKQGIGGSSSQMEHLVGKISIYEQQIIELQNKLEVLQAAFPASENTKQINALIEQKDADIIRLSKILEDRNEQVKALENLLAETKEQFALLNVFATGKVSPGKNEVLN